MIKKKRNIFVCIVKLKNIMAIVAVLFCAYIVSKVLNVVQTDALSKQKLPVVMYHSVINDISRAGEYVITPEMFENDLKKIKASGYTTVNCSDLVDFVYASKELPEKCVMLTLDDGTMNNYTYVYPLLEKYDMKCVISVVGEYTDMYSKEDAVLNDRYSYLSYTQIKELSDSGRVEIGNHTYHMHNMDKRKGVLKKKGENEEIYRNTLMSDVEKLQDTLYKNCGIIPVVFTYPYGAVNNLAQSIIRSMGFKVTLGCEEGVNIIDGAESLYNLKRYNRSADFDILKILK